MGTAVQVFVLSPHLDDAVFSCGGAIAHGTANGTRVTVVTTFAGDAPATLSPLAERLHRSWRLRTDVVARRRDEDRVALRILGAEAAHWRLPEAIYRMDRATSRPLYGELTQLFQNPRPAEAEVLDELVCHISRLPADGALIVPLAAGGHVDHHLVRNAAEQVTGRSRIYYEDFPYSARAGAIDRAIGTRRRWRTVTIGLDERALRAKYAAAASYRSQLRSQFRTRLHLRLRLWLLHRRLGGERYWIPDLRAEGP